MTLFVTADDFGLCREVNEAVCLLHDRGIVSHASFLVNTDLFDQGVSQLKIRPGLSVGIHLNVTDGIPVAPVDEVPTLVNRDGVFGGGRHYSVLARILRGHISMSDVRVEWTAQVEKLQSSGLRIDHLNAHGHLHLVPRLHGIVVDLMERFRIPYVRLVKRADSLRELPLAFCSRQFLREIGRKERHFRYPDHVMGLDASGHLTPARIRRALRFVSPGPSIFELVVHPSLGDNEFHRGWGYSGETETEALLAEETLSLLHRLRVDGNGDPTDGRPENAHR